MKLYLIITICIILFYIYCYFINPTYISILQTSLQEFDFNMLFKKQPLVIEDKTKNVLSILQAWFSPNIIQDTNYNNDRTWNMNTYKYLYCYALYDTEIFIYSPIKTIIDDKPDTNEPILAIKLKTNQSLIIPYRWYYNIKNNNDIKLYGIHDYITFVLGYFI